MKAFVFETKYWTAVVEGTTLRTRFGKVGRPGQTRLKSFATAAAATSAMAEAIAAKKREGYTASRTDPTGAKPQRSGKPVVAKATPSAKLHRKRDALLALATQLGGATVVAQVALAADSPEAYAKKYPMRMDDRSLDVDDGNLAWIALVDALHAKKQLVDLDWKQGSDDTLRWLQRIASPAGKRALAPLLDDDTLTTGDTLELAGAALTTTGEALLELDISSDCYEMIVVPAADAAPLIKLARTAGESIVHFKGKSRTALAKARIREAARTEAARADPWNKLVEESVFQNIYDVLGAIPRIETALAEIRAALPFVPPADRPFVQLAVDLNSKSALAVARDAKDARLALRATPFMAEFTAAQLATRFRAVAILVRRLKLSPNPGKAHEVAAYALASYADDGVVAAALAALPAADREVLARLADGLFTRAQRGTDRMGDAILAIKSVGDATTLAMLETRGHRKAKGDLGEAVEQIRARVK